MCVVGKTIRFLLCVRKMLEQNRITSYMYVYCDHYFYRVINPAHYSFILIINRIDCAK